jgi:hypothetical protein
MNKAHLSARMAEGFAQEGGKQVGTFGRDIASQILFRLPAQAL